MAKLFRITTVPVSVEKLLGKQLTFMNQFYEVTAISSDKEDLERVGQELGIRTKAIEMTRKITPIQDLKSLWQMYCYLKKEKKDKLSIVEFCNYMNLSELDVRKCLNLVPRK